MPANRFANYRPQQIPLLDFRDGYWKSRIVPTELLYRFLLLLSYKTYIRTLSHFRSQPFFISLISLKTISIRAGFSPGEVASSTEVPA